MAIALLVAPPGARAQLAPEAARLWVERHGMEAVRQLGELAAIPSVASNPAGLTEARRWLAARLERYGFRTRELDGGHVPALYAERTVDPRARTLLLYFHYDGQEADASQWRTDPFLPTLFDAAGREIGPVVALPAGQRLDPDMRVYARAVADDKAPIAAFLAALALLEERRIRPAANLKLFLEGDEESSSPGMRRMLENPEYARLLEPAEAVIILDAPRFPTNPPTLYLGTRGIVTADLTVYGANRPLHSGHYGNWAVNPALELSRLLASMVDDDGRVLVEGYYNGRTPLTPLEEAALARLPQVDEEVRREFGIPRAYGGGRRLHELITYPSLNVRGLGAGYIGAQATTSIPDRATAALDLRLVPGQTDQAVLASVRAHLERLGYHVLDREPTPEERLAHPRLAQFRRRPGGYASFRTPMDHRAVQQAVRIVEQATGTTPVVLPTIGGSGPLVLFRDVLGLAPFGIAIYNYDCNQHAANENVRVREFLEGIRIIAALIANYGR